MELKKELFNALIQAQVELKNPAKNKKGYGYDYSTLDSILEQVKPVLSKYGLTIIQLLSGDSTKVGVTTILAHKSGESIQDTLFLPLVEMKNMNAVQAMGASVTYGRRYGLTSILGISSDDDTDASDSDKKDVSKSNVASTMPLPKSFSPVSVPPVAAIPKSTLATPPLPTTSVVMTEEANINVTPSNIASVENMSVSNTTEAPKSNVPLKPKFNVPTKPRFSDFMKRGA